MKKYLLGFLATVGAVAVLTGLCALIYSWKGRGRIPSNTILEVDFEQGVIETVPDDPVARLVLGKKPVVRDIVEALERAAGDKRVAGLVARVGEGEMSLAQVQEIRDAVVAFRGAGKFAIAYAETFGEFAKGNSAYCLATAFDQIYLQPSGDLSLSGLIAERYFVRGTLDKLGLTPRFDHRYEYKSAMNILTERKFTESHREATTKIMESQFGQLVRAVAGARKMSEDEVRGVIDRGPYIAPEALAAKLVDGLAYRDEVYEKAKDRAGKKARFLALPKYLDRAGRPHEKGAVIALIYAVGEVTRGKNGFDPVLQMVTMGSDDVAAAFRAATQDRDVKAILLRVDSPGGSYVASDTIWRAVSRARQAGKPVIVSMGAVAGSGGYFISIPADKIVAQPATLTGSIGVVAGKFVTTNFWDKLGISWDEVHTSSNAMIYTGLQDYTPEQWARFGGWLDRVYEDFTSKVGIARKLPKEKVLEIAKGRVWTGEDAKALGLVDELGGFPVALRLVRAAAGLPADGKIHLKEFPAKKSLLASLMSDEPDSSEKVAGDAAVRAMKLLEPVARMARQARVGVEGEELLMPEIY